MQTKLILNDGTTYEAESYGAPISSAGEVVFSTGMVGYPESLTDPSYKGQILILTYPLIGNYGVPDPSFWESNQIQVSGLIVSDYIDTPSHYNSTKTLAQWFRDENLPLIQIKDTRALTQKIREQGTMLGKIVINQNIPFYDPNIVNLVDEVSTKKIEIFYSSPKQKTVILIDCGAKNNIKRCLLNRGVNIILVPWDTDIFSSTFKNQLEDVIARSESDLPAGTQPKQSRESTGSPRSFLAREDNFFDAIVISNGPGDPKMADKTIKTIKKSLENKIPTLGVCLGNQLLALAAGGDTYKLKFGHRSQNQPCLLAGYERCYITTQNHGFAIGEMPPGFKPWFINANDNTIEGIIHDSSAIMAVQFHPEATPGPYDTEWIFDYFLEKIK